MNKTKKKQTKIIKITSNYNPYMSVGQPRRSNVEPLFRGDQHKYDFMFCIQFSVHVPGKFNCKMLVPIPKISGCDTSAHKN